MLDIGPPRTPDMSQPDGSTVEVTRARARDVLGSTLMDLVRGLPSSHLERALTHSSWVEERTVSYERLEFLGDSVLGLAIASTLCARYPHKDEGDLARSKAFVVSRASCSQVARRLDVPGLIRAQAPGSASQREEAAGSTTVLGNVLEALIGACFQAYGYDLTSKAVTEAFDEQIAYAVTEYVDYKTDLQEVLAARGLQPGYELVGEDGPPHARTFTSEVSVDGHVRGTGTGTTIKMSEQAAAQEALAFFSNREESS